MSEPDKETIKEAALPAPRKSIIQTRRQAGITPKASTRKTSPVTVLPVTKRKSLTPPNSTKKPSSSMESELVTPQDSSSLKKSEGSDDKKGTTEDLKQKKAEESTPVTRKKARQKTPSKASNSSSRRSSCSDQSATSHEVSSTQDDNVAEKKETVEKDVTQTDVTERKSRRISRRLSSEAKKEDTVDVESISSTSESTKMETEEPDIETVSPENMHTSLGKTLEVCVSDIKKESPEMSHGSNVASKKTIPGGMKRKLSAGAEVKPQVAHSFQPPLKKQRTLVKTAGGQLMEKDYFCWQCHKEEVNISCELCARSFHLKCLGFDEPGADWVCQECEASMRAECADTRSKAMAMINLDQLCQVLRYTLARMKQAESGPFLNPVDEATVPSYTCFVIYPMDLYTLEKNIQKKSYGSTEAFHSDAKWILHNCIIFNGFHHPFTSSAKNMLRICKQELAEIEVCPDCYRSAYSAKDENWFVEPCRIPHPLVWAKLKGYPFWPAKALREENGQIDARFFGDHDRAWVSISNVFMMSKEPPNAIRQKRGGNESLDELLEHITKLRQKFGSFEYAPFKTPYTSQKFKSVKKSGNYSGKKLIRLKSPLKSTTTSGSEKTAAVIKRSLVFGGASKSAAEGKPVEKLSIAWKTASAVKQKYTKKGSRKYNSIITTRKAAAALKQGKVAVTVAVASPMSSDSEKLQFATTIKEEKNSGDVVDTLGDTADLISEKSPTETMTNPAVSENEELTAPKKKKVPTATLR